MLSPEEIAQRHAETLSTFRKVEAHYRSEIERLEAENAELTQSIPDVPSATDGGAQGRYALKTRIVQNELKLDTMADELGKLQPQIDEAEAAIAAAKPKRETRPLVGLETR